MTGFGEARAQRDGLSLTVEVRSINSRYLKMTIRCGEGYAALEPLVESALRNRLSRGAVLVNVRIVRARAAEEYQLDTRLLDHYRSVLLCWREQSGISEEIPLAALLELPGVVLDDPATVCEPERDWPLVREALDQAVAGLDAMRAEEGRAMAADLDANCKNAIACLDRIHARAPLVVDNYRSRLEERLRKILAEYQLTLNPSDVLKEVGLFAERTDISEEIVRLRSHFEQFETIMGSSESAGRKLEFLTQEMFREANTIGSKSNDVEITREVIEIKAALERIREMIQNIE